jgi:MerR family transcriptional regulator, light-induced transcriptional regulator
MDHRIVFTETLRQALRGFVASDQYRTQFTAQRIHPAFDRDMIQQMALLSFEVEDVNFIRHAQKMLQSCIDAEQFLVQAIAGAAMVLGDWWASDQLNVQAVKLGSERLLDLVYEVADQRLLMGHEPSNPHTIMLSMASESTHTLGLAVMGEVFHWHGWNVIASPTMAHDTLRQRLQEQWVDVLGFSLADDRHIEDIQQLIETCRHISRNRQMWVMIGGPQAILRPQLAAEVGADAASSNASQAQAMALARVRQLTQTFNRATENRG